MTLRRKIAVALRRLADRFDDRPKVDWDDVAARLAACHAIPRRVNRYTQKVAFSNGPRGSAEALDDPKVIAWASRMERKEPGLYAGNDDMVAAIARYRAGERFDDMAGVVVPPSWSGGA